MKTQCPHCNAIFNDIANDLNEQIVTCSNCKEEFVVEPFTTAPSLSSLKKEKKALQLSIHPKFFFLDKLLIVFANILALIFFIIVWLNKNEGAFVILLTIEIFLFTILIIVYLRSKIILTTTTYTITQDIITVQTGWLNKNKTAIRISDLREVSVNKPWQLRWFNLGNILLSTSSHSGYEVVLLGLKDPDTIANKIEALRDKD